MITLLERPYQVCFSRNPVAYKLQTNTALATQGLKIDVRLMFRRFGANDFIQQIAISLVPDSSGIAEIDFSKVLDSLVDYSLPAITTAVPERAFDQVGEFYVGYREITTAAPNPVWTTDSSTIRVIKGGLPYEKWQGPNYFINNNGVLTWQKTGRLIGPTEKAWYTYLHLGTNNQANMAAKVNLYFTDGTVQTNAVTINFPDTAVPKYGIYRIPVGAQLALKDVQPAKTIHYYTVRIVANTTDLTVAFKYIVDYRGNYSRITLYYLNSLGGLDSIRLLGELGKKVAYDRQFSEKTLGGKYYSTTEIASMQENIKNVEQVTYSGSVGLMDDEDQYDRIRDLMISTKVQMIKFNRWAPVLVTNNSVDMGTNSDPVKDFPVDFTPGYVNESYAPDIRVGDLPVCPLITTFSAAAGVFTWGPSSASHVQYVVELWDVLQTVKQQTILTAGTSYTFTEFGLIGYARVKAICGFSETPFTDFVYIAV